LAEIRFILRRVVPCELGHDEPMTGLSGLRAFLEATERQPVPAAWPVAAAETLTGAAVS